VQAATAQPSAAGGALVDGTYFLTSYTIHTGSGGNSGPTGTKLRQTMTLSGTGTALQTARAKDGAEVKLNATLAASGTNVTITFTCGPTGGTSLGYTASGNTLLLLDAANKNVQTFTKQ
jgi:hypothetical protein